MTNLVDFLPATYRDRRVDQRARRLRIAVGLLIVIGIVVMDLGFQLRISSIRQSVSATELEAADAERRARETDSAEQKFDRLRRELTLLTAPLQRPSVSTILDDLLRELPATVHFHELQCRVDPWSVTAQPEVRLDASSSDLNTVSTYLRSVRESTVLPPLQFERTNLGVADGHDAFRLVNQEGGP